MTGLVKEKVEKRAAELRTSKEKAESPTRTVSRTPVRSQSFRGAVKIAANKRWQRACPVKQGDHVAIRAQGTWNTWPDGGSSWKSDANGTKFKARKDFPLPSARQGALIGRIGSKVFVVGTSAQIEVQQDGELHLMNNDAARYRPDNKGTIVVAIEITRKTG